jgi:hypothetical protein
MPQLRTQNQNLGLWFSATALRGELSQFGCILFFYLAQVRLAVLNSRSSSDHSSGWFSSGSSEPSFLSSPLSFGIISSILV